MNNFIHILRCHVPFAKGDPLKSISSPSTLLCPSLIEVQISDTAWDPFTSDGDWADIMASTIDGDGTIVTFLENFAAPKRLCITLPFQAMKDLKYAMWYNDEGLIWTGVKSALHNFIEGVPFGSSVYIHNMADRLLWGLFAQCPPGANYDLFYHRAGVVGLKNNVINAVLRRRFTMYQIMLNMGPPDASHQFRHSHAVITMEAPW